MVDPFAFTFAAFALLLTPGPTNTLLMTSGVAAGLRRSIILIVAELLGYTTSIFLLVLVFGPIVQKAPAVGSALKVVGAVYLLTVAAVLWKRGGLVSQQSRPVEFYRVFITTLLNPKSLIFTFFIVPHLFDGRRVEALPYLLALALMILLAGAGWVSSGALIDMHLAKNRGGGIAQRLGAVAQMSFAAVLLGSVLWK